MSRAIFFDLDGTLTDSGPGIINCASWPWPILASRCRTCDQLRVLWARPCGRALPASGFPRRPWTRPLPVSGPGMSPLENLKTPPTPALRPAGPAARCGIPSFRGHLQAPGHRPGGAGGGGAAHLRHPPGPVRPGSGPHLQRHPQCVRAAQRAGRQRLGGTRPVHRPADVDMAISG